jgi:hypothetical protein
MLFLKGDLAPLTTVDQGHLPDIIGIISVIEPQARSDVTFESVTDQKAC